MYVLLYNDRPRYLGIKRLKKWDLLNTAVFLFYYTLFKAMVSPKYKLFSFLLFPLGLRVPYNLATRCT